MNKHGDVLRHSEAMTRYALIDPLLALVGWDIHDPEQVRPEYSVGGGAVDYALMRGGKPLFFVEAKAMDGNLTAGTVQNINYCLQAGTPYLVATDGRRWTIYDTHKPVPLSEKEIVGFDLSDPDLRTVLVKALFLWQPTLPVPVPHREQHEPKGHDHHSGTVPLAQLQVKLKDKPPARLLLPNGSQPSLNYWNELFVRVADYLYGEGKLSAAVCPVAKSHATRYLVNISPQHSNGARFYAPRKVGNLWVDTDYDAPAMFRNTLFLISHLGESPDTFMVQIR